MKYSQWKRACLDVLYPEGAVCLGCGRISDGNCLCPDCRRDLRHAGMLYAWDRRMLDGVPVWSMRLHEGLARTLVLKLKFDADACAAEALADILLPLPEELTLSPDTVITWVPMPASRRRERCVDHAHLLAQAFAGRLRLLCRPLLLRRETGEHTQRGLSLDRRARNLEKAYAPVQRITFPVVLVDDVLTSGTTVRRCIAALRQGGAKEIVVLTVTHAG